MWSLAMMTEMLEGDNHTYWTGTIRRSKTKNQKSIENQWISARQVSLKTVQFTTSIATISIDREASINQELSQRPLIMTTDWFHHKT